jgi:hypothetical protein
MGEKKGVCFKCRMKELFRDDSVYICMGCGQLYEEVYPEQTEIGMKPMYFDLKLYHKLQMRRIENQSSCTNKV